MNSRLGGLKVKYKFLEDLKTLLQEKDPDYLVYLEDTGALDSPNFVARELTRKFVGECPVGTRAFRDGETIMWLRNHYDQTQD